jgi:D-amino-acid dehydrogenase
VSTYDAAVVGGGIVGAATALELGRAGARTLVFDRGDRGGATAAGAGILSPETAARDDPAWTALARSAGLYYETLLPELVGETGWARCGILELATRDSDVPAWEWLAARATGGGEIPVDEARAMCPVLGDPVRVLHHPGAARVDGHLMRGALLRTAVERFGVDVRDESIDDVRALDARVMVVAGGAWTPEIARQLGASLPIRPVRGQIVHLGVPAHDTAAWPMVQPVHGHYMVPWTDARVAVGATVEDAGFDCEPTAAGIREVLREALRVMPGLADACWREVRVGLRPWSADDMPIIGALPGGGNVFVCTGHGANGLLLGPISGALVAAAALGNTPALDLTPFSPARFSVRA